jgi:hypothetical protein
MALILIDQSGKVEKTNKLTVVASASGKTGFTVLLSSSLKKMMCQEIKQLSGSARHSRFPLIKLFSFCIYLSLPHLKPDDSIVIDLEYEGRSHEIKSQLLEFIREKYPQFKKEQIAFVQIGKKEYVHKLANETFRGIRKPDRVVSEADLNRLFGKRKR